MTLFEPHMLPFLSPVWFVSIAVGLAVGYVAGLLHFRSLKGVARRLARGDWTAIAIQMARLALLGVLLFILTRWGAQTLLAGTAGIFLARRRVLAKAESEAET